MSGWKCDVSVHVVGDIPDPLPTRQCDCSGQLTLSQLQQLPPGVSILNGPIQNTDNPAYFNVTLRFTQTLSVTDSGTLNSDPSGCTLFDYQLIPDETVVKRDEDVYRKKGETVIVAQPNLTKRFYFGDDGMFNGRHINITEGSNGSFLIQVRLYDSMDSNHQQYAVLNVSPDGKLLDLNIVENSAFLNAATGVVFDNLRSIGTEAEFVNKTIDSQILFNMLSDPNGVPVTVQGQNLRISPVLYYAMMSVSGDPLTALMSLNGICKLIPKADTSSPAKPQIKPPTSKATVKATMANIYAVPGISAGNPPVSQKAVGTDLDLYEQKDV